jgi:hypothetical protein
MSDENGHTTQSNRIVVVNKVSGFDVVNLVPTVVTSSAILNVTAAKKMPLTVVVTDIAGRVLQKNNYYLIAGSNQLKINSANLAAGFYQLSTYTSNGEIKTVRFVKQ